MLAALITLTLVVVAGLLARWSVTRLERCTEPLASTPSNWDEWALRLSERSSALADALDDDLPR